MVVPPTALRNLRRELRKRRQSIAIQRKFFAPKEREAFDDRCRAAACLALYLPAGGEPDPIVTLANFTGRTALPAITAADQPMVFRYWSPCDPLITASWGGGQPTDSAAIATPDVILVPLLAFDADFNRIGQGGGYYDRYLAAHPKACRIGIAWEGQRVDRIDAQPWDVPMDAILTEIDFHIRDLDRCPNQ